MSSSATTTSSVDSTPTTSASLAAPIPSSLPTANTTANNTAGRNNRTNSTDDSTDFSFIPASNTLPDGLLEPPNGKRYLSAWLDYTKDTPSAFNERMNLLASAFHFGMDLPLAANQTPPFDLIDKTKTNAALFLTVFPRVDYASLTTSHLDLVVRLCASFNQRGRSVFLRFAPDMNAYWNRWGQKPSRFIDTWMRLRKMFDTHIEANQTAFVWAPYEGSAYSFQNDTNVTRDDFQRLDTNKDGVLDNRDDPYLPFYPGDNLVDWVGLSVYFRGRSFPWGDNNVPLANTFVNVINGSVPFLNYSFYQEFVVKRKKPMMIAETGAIAYTSPDPTAPLPGAKPLEIKLAWWRQFMTNTTFFAMFPRVKMINLFEFNVLQNNVFLDYQQSNSTTGTLSAFSSDLVSVRDSYALSSRFDGVTWSPVDVFATIPPNSDHPSPSWAFSLLVIIPLVGVISWFGYSLYQKKRRGASDSQSQEDQVPARSRRSILSFRKPPMSVSDVDETATVVNGDDSDNDTMNEDAFQAIPEILEGGDEYYRRSLYHDIPNSGGDIVDNNSSIAAQHMNDGNDSLHTAEAPSIYQSETELPVIAQIYIPSTTLPRSPPTDSLSVSSMTISGRGGRSRTPSF